MAVFGLIMLPRLKMRTYSFLLSAAVGLAELCRGQTGNETQFEDTLAMPLYEAGYVLNWDAPRYSTFTLYGPDTKAVYSLPNTQAAGALCLAWAMDADGAGARAYHDREQQGRIDVLDVSGKVTRTITTGSYEPTHVTFAPDHSIWTVGFVDHYEEQSDFNVVRHYSRTGEQLSEAVPWSEIAADHNAYTALQPIIGGRRLFAASDRIGFISEASPGNAKWIEVSYAGRLLAQYDLGLPDGKFFVPAAMTASGNVYAKLYKDQHFTGYGFLDKSNGARRMVSGCPKGWLIGTNGDDLVFAQHVTAWTVLHKVASSAVSVREALDGPVEAAIRRAGH